MKRFCKNVNIVDINFIYAAVVDCLNKRCKRTRRDTIKLFAYYGNCSKKEAVDILINRNGNYDLIIWRISARLLAELYLNKIKLPPINIKARLDGNSGKIRKISVQHIWQLFYDHIAVRAMSELNRLMGEHQVSGRKHMGFKVGHKLIRKWVYYNKKKVYFAKLDIKHYYESVSISLLIKWLLKRINNPALMHLIVTLLNTGELGLNIGSYLSHFLANLYLSDVWHKAMQCIPGILHALFYMDDILLLSYNKRKLKLACNKIILLLKQKQLQVKDWQIRVCNKSNPIDIMGLRFSNYRISLRKKIFRRTRRTFLRLERHTINHAQIPVRLAKRTMSFNGWLCFAKPLHINLQNKQDYICDLAKWVISDYSKYKVLHN